MGGIVITLLLQEVTPTGTWSIVSDTLEDHSCVGTIIVNPLLSNYMSVEQTHFLYFVGCSREVVIAKLANLHSWLSIKQNHSGYNCIQAIHIQNFVLCSECTYVICGQWGVAVCPHAYTYEDPSTLRSDVIYSFVCVCFYSVCWLK